MKNINKEKSIAKLRKSDRKNLVKNRAKESPIIKALKIIVASLVEHGIMTEAQVKRTNRLLVEQENYLPY